MLAQRLAGDEEAAKRKAENVILIERRDPTDTATEGEVVVEDYDNDDNDISAVPAVLFNS